MGVGNDTDYSIGSVNIGTARDVYLTEINFLSAVGVAAVCGKVEIVKTDNGLKKHLSVKAVEEVVGVVKIV